MSTIFDVIRIWNAFANLTIRACYVIFAHISVIAFKYTNSIHTIHKKQIENPGKLHACVSYATYFRVRFYNSYVPYYCPQRTEINPNVLWSTTGPTKNRKAITKTLYRTEKDLCHRGPKSVTEDRKEHFLAIIYRVKMWKGISPNEKDLLQLGVVPKTTFSHQLSDK